jgi:hypothetical protein
MRRRAQRILTSTPDPEPMLAHFELWLRRLVARAGSTGARVVLARQPWCERQYAPAELEQMWSFAAGRPYVQDVPEYYAHETAWALLAQVDRRAEKVARELALEQIDLNRVVPRDLEHYYDEMHHTPRGCELVGRAIAQQIVAGARPRAAIAGARVPSALPAQAPGIEAGRAAAGAPRGNAHA